MDANRRLELLRRKLAEHSTDEAAAASLYRSTMPKLAVAAVSKKEEK